MNKKIIDFNEGEHISTNLLVTSLTKGTTNSGAPYLTLVLQDNTKTIDAKMWDVKPEIEKQLDIITQNDIQKAINKEALTHSPKSVKNMHGLVSAVFGVYRPDFRLKTKLLEKDMH